MKIGFSTGYREEFWKGWPWSTQYGGSEHIVVELARQFAAMGHDVTVRLPRSLGGVTSIDGITSIEETGVLWIGEDAPAVTYDILFCFDDFERKDSGDRTVLVACRSDPPPHTEFDELIFLSRTHARLMGHPDRPAIGGGVDLGAYAGAARRRARRVIYTSSPDRGLLHAAHIGRHFDFAASYRGARELTREDLVALQRTARALIHPCDPVRPSEFFCMSVLEAMAAGTPCLISDADALPELWAEAAIVLPRPIRYGEWVGQAEDLLADSRRWRSYSELGQSLAAKYAWPLVAGRYLSIAKG